MQLAEDKASEPSVFSLYNLLENLGSGRSKFAAGCRSHFRWRRHRLRFFLPRFTTLKLQIRFRYLSAKPWVLQMHSQIRFDENARAFCSPAQARHDMDAAHIRVKNASRTKRQLAEVAQLSGLPMLLQRGSYAHRS